MMMKSLLVDTSGSRLGMSLALQQGEITASASFPTGKGMSEDLLETIDFFLHKSRVTLASLDRLAVVVGPGSFTGVRIGVATMMGLSAGSGVPLVGISSLDAAALVSGADSITVATRMKGKLFAVKEYTFASDTFSAYDVREANPAEEGLYLINTASHELNRQTELSHAIGDLRFERFLCPPEPLYLRKSEAELNFDASRNV